MESEQPRDVTESEIGKLSALLDDLQIRPIIAKHKPQNIEVEFEVKWLEDEALAASYPRKETTGPYFITLSPLLVEYGFTDKIGLSTIILHELGHVVDRVKNWNQNHPKNEIEKEEFEFRADDFVIECGWRDNLIYTLRRSVAAYNERNVPAPLTAKRLSRLVSA